LCATIYTLARAGEHSHALMVTVERKPGRNPTVLWLRGSRMAAGLSPDVADIRCDGERVARTAADSWRIPARCRHVSWRVQRALPGSSDAGMQRSVAAANGSFCLFSEAVSLPRLKDASPPEYLSVRIPSFRAIEPEPSPAGLVRLPDDSRPPLFLAMGARKMPEEKAGRVRVRYFMDDAGQIASLPPIGVEARGLSWLNGLVQGSGAASFSIVWLGMPKSSASMGGASGDRLLLANYLRDATATPLVAEIPLNEAAHRIGAESGSNEPRWVGESISTWLGLEALRHAEPGESGPRDLQNRFARAAERFTAGLLTVHRQVNAGNSAAYGVFFTRGVAFWMAVNDAIREAGRPGLSAIVADVRTAKYETDGSPPRNFAAILGISARKWHLLRHRFLD
jgi:hypothetical protein